MPRHLYTPNTVALVRTMAEQGHSASTIAAKIGSTPSSVRVRCSQLKIKLRRTRVKNSHPPLQRTERGVEHLVVTYLPGPLYTTFHRQAVHMNKSVSVLAGLLLEAIVTGDLYDAVLDERD
jgi:hypothetical protein